MDFEKEYNSTIRKFKRAIEAMKGNLRAHLMGLSKEERYRVMREDFSPSAVKEISQWAITEEDYEICATAKEVIANNEAEFEINFTQSSENDGTGEVVKFRDVGGNTFYHVDYQTKDGRDGTLVMLHRNAETGVWNSEWASSNPDFFEAIGNAIDRYEQSN